MSNQSADAYRQRHPLFSIYQNIVQRCHNPNAPRRADYGGRGVAVCDQWRKSFATFEADIMREIGPRPSLRHSIDRWPDKDGDYEPGNVRWATAKTQARNRRDNRLITFEGETMPAAAWAERAGMSRNALQHRLGNWSSLACILNAPLRRRA